MYQDVGKGLNNNTQSYSPAITVQKAFHILELIGERQPLRAVDIVKELGLTRANVHRLLATLISLGYVEKVHENSYQLTYKMFRLGSMVTNSRSLVEIARPYLLYLSEESGETVNLAVRYEGRLIYIDKAESKHPLASDQPVGQTDPLHSTALGKVLLSGMDDEELARFLKGIELKKFTENTITEEEKLMEEIREVRRRGYALDLQENNDHINCVAAPVFNYENRVIAAVSITGPAVRFTKEQIDGIVIRLSQTTHQISEKMGCSVPGNVYYKMMQKQTRESKKVHYSSNLK